MLLVRPRHVLIEQWFMEADTTARMRNKPIRYDMNVVNAGADGNCDLSKPARTSLCAVAVGRMGWPCTSVEHVPVLRRPVPRDRRHDPHSRRDVSHGIGPSLSGGGARASRVGRPVLDRPHTVTTAQIPPDSKDYLGALPHMIYAGSLVFVLPRHVAGLQDWSQWRTLMKGADWRHPGGPNSSINVLDNHPVVHVSFADALAYAQWAGKDVI
jgi:hypothetical protein